MHYFKSLVLFTYLGFFGQTYTYSSDFGTTGLIDIPTARMKSDGILTATTAIQSRTNSYSITYQAMPWLEATFRYTGYNDFFFYDRNYAAKLKLWSENRYLPQVAVGIRDMVGTGFANAEYIVASKEMGDFDFTLGIGWGRLADDSNIRNPLALISSRFETRITKGEGLGVTGTVQSSSWFRGENVGLFGGVSYRFESVPLSLMLEYNPDQYINDINFPGSTSIEPKSPFTAAVKWDALPGVAITLSHQHNQEWGIGFSAKLNTKMLPSKPSRPLYQSSLDLGSSDLPKGINQKSWYDKFLFDAERSGLLLLEATVDDSLQTATIVMGNVKYPVWADALAFMANLADLHLPTKVNTLNIVVEEEGHRVNSVRMRRPSLNFDKNKQLVEREIKIEPFRPVKFIQHRTNFVQKKLLLDVNLSNRVQLFDPDDPIRYQLYAKIGLSMMLPRDWVFSGAIDKDISNNFDESTRVSDSVLTRVRSDIVKYLNEGESGLDSLYVQKRGNLNNNIYFRWFGGVLESMYSGIGGEILHQSFQSRVAFGLSANWVKQRDYDKMFDHLEYQTTTAFVSAYWATPFHNFDIAIHAGKYLAKDLGATFEVRRTFDNGWMVGLWATKTNVSAEEFGEGSFDKGLFFKMPLNGFLGTSSRSNYTTRIRPTQRDGGQYLEDFMGKIWWDIRGVRYDALSNSVWQLSR